MQNKTKIYATLLAASAAFFVTLEKHEGFSAKPYKDTGGIITQGIGSTVKPDGSKIKMTDKPIDRKTAQEWVKAHVSKDEVAFKKSLQGVKLSQTEYNNYLDFVYNFGQNNWNNSSMLRNLRVGKYEEACKSLLKWRYVAGKDCSVRKNNCYGVYTRQLERYNQCMSAN